MHGGYIVNFLIKPFYKIKYFFTALCKAVSECNKTLASFYQFSRTVIC
jgi:hypothetical protein